MYKFLIISYFLLLLNCNGTNTRSFIFNYEVSILPTDDKNWNYGYLIHILMRFKP